MTDELVDEVVDAKRLKKPWAVTAVAVRRRLASAGEPVSVRSATLNACSMLSGYSAPILLRQQALLDTLDEVAGMVGAEVDRLRGLPFSVLELASSLYRQKPEAGLDAIKDVIAGKADVKTLRWALETASQGEGSRTGLDVIARERHERRARVYRILSEVVPELKTRPKDWGVEEGRRRGFDRPPICRFDWWRRQGQRRPYPDFGDYANYPEALEGYDLTHAPAGSTAKWLDDRIARVLVSSLFFDLYWIVLSEPSPFVERIASAVSIMGRKDIGILTIDLQGAVREERRPELIHSGKDQALIRDFAPDRVGS
ncbi:hypothetical protein ACVIW2_005922 [Bradyrhizobium huanghuaihaiense]